MDPISPRKFARLKDWNVERMQSRLLIPMIAVMFGATIANAAPINYGDFIGGGPGAVDFLSVREASVTDPAPPNDPLFGAPIHDANRLIFQHDMLFASFSSGGSADTTSGTLSMIIRADMGSFLEEIVIQETGDWSMLGAGTNATSATVNGLLALTELAPGTSPTMTSALVVTPTPAYHLPTEPVGEFEAITFIDLTGLGITEVVISLNNNLQTTSEDGTVSFIQKKSVVITVNEPPIPEPATLSLVGMTGLLILRRKRRA